MSAKKKSGPKFDQKYKVKPTTIYRGNTAAMKIPPPGHPLYDETAPTEPDPFRVAAIDRDGKMTDPIEVWTDPDRGLLWVVDGRGRWLDVQAVNRERAKEKRELVEPLIVTFTGDEKAAIARVREKNYHRRVPTLSHQAVDLLAMRRAGHSWLACAEALHVVTGDAEQWGRRLLPLAYCIPEVRQAIDEKRIPIGMVRQFAGRALDGSERLGDRQQAELLKELLEEKRSAPPRHAVGSTGKARIVETLSNGSVSQLKTVSKIAADAVRATIARLAGDEAAFDAWPDLKEVVEKALEPRPAGRPAAREE